MMISLPELAVCKTSTNFSPLQPRKTPKLQGGANRAPNSAEVKKNQRNSHQTVQLTLIWERHVTENHDKLFPKRRQEDTTADTFATAMETNRSANFSSLNSEPPMKLQTLAGAQDKAIGAQSSHRHRYCSFSTAKRKSYR